MNLLQNILLTLFAIALIIILLGDFLTFRPW